MTGSLSLTQRTFASVPRHSSVQSIRLALLGLALLGVLVGCGWLVARGHTKWLLIAAVAGALCLLAIQQRGYFIGVMVLAAMNGVPFFDTAPYVASKATIADIAVIGMILVSGAWILADRDHYRPTPAARAISGAGAVLLLWWTFTIVRTLSEEGPLTRAASFGRGFAFFALLLIVLPHVRLSDRDIGRLLGVLAVGVCVFAVGQTMIGTGLGDPGSVIHLQFTLADSGLTRVYANMTDLVTAGLAVSIAACLLGRGRVRLVALPIALVLTTSTLVQLTRARWIGLVVALVLVGTWLMVSGDAQSIKTLRRRLKFAVGPTVAVAAATTLAIPGILSNATVGNRLSSVFVTLQTGGGTVAIREAVTNRMIAYLGEGWTTGLGFVSPTTHFYFGLPSGSIQNTDLGVLNAVMTMGIVGAVLVYAPVVIVLLFLLRRGSQRGGTYSWLRYGGLLWIVATLASSVTLVTLFSPSGLVLSAVALIALTHSSVLGAAQTREDSRKHAEQAARAPVNIDISRYSTI
ncbi:MAG TPA: hypothetical protein VHU13_06840 [Solirubrobacteraceae bacterium]|jgi:hypothetical protein|nr:hypothetical protein [Solirubrobacteraceae bacterium]